MSYFCLSIFILRGGVEGSSHEEKTEEDKEVDYGDFARTMLEAVEVLGGMRRRIAACRDSIYSGVPFLCVVVDPEFVPYPVLTIRYVGEANRIAVERDCIRTMYLVLVFV